MKYYSLNYEVKVIVKNKDNYNKMVELGEMDSEAFGYIFTGLSGKIKCYEDFKVKYSLYIDKEFLEDVLGIGNESMLERWAKSGAKYVIHDSVISKLDSFDCDCYINSDDDDDDNNVRFINIT